MSIIYNVYSLSLYKLFYWMEQDWLRKQCFFAVVGSLFTHASLVSQHSNNCYLSSLPFFSLRNWLRSRLDNKQVGGGGANSNNSKKAWSSFLILVP